MLRGRTIYHLIKKYSRYFVPLVHLQLALLLLMVIANVGSLATPYFLKIIIDDIFPSGNLASLGRLLALLVFIYVIRIICTISTDVLYARISSTIVSNIRVSILSNLLHRPIQYFKSLDTGKVLYTIMNDVENIQSAFSSLMLVFINNLISIVGILIMLGILNFKLTLISISIFPFIFYSIYRFTPQIQNKFKRIQEIHESLNTFFLEKIRNIRVIKSFNTIRFERDKLDLLQKLNTTTNVKSALLTSLNSNITTFFIAIGPIIVLIFGGKDVFNGSMTIGGLIAFIQYLNRLYSPAVSVMDGYNQLNKIIVSMERVSEYVSAPHKTFNSKNISLMGVNTIILKNVSLEISRNTVLTEINLTFEKGKIYGIIGPSGSGKSTICNLLCGFMRPTLGEILVDNNIPISEIDNWSEYTALIEKENQIFNDSIIENIRYGSFNSNYSDIERVMCYAGLGKVIDKLENGINAVVNETGSILSDGQKQRISICRALLKNAPLIIFDESMSSLDIELEQYVIKNLRLFFKNSIIIIVTHRHDTLPLFDKVYSISNGQIVN